MASLKLDQVVDLDCVVAFSPLVLDMPAGKVYARGRAAIARRVLYQWAAEAGILDLEGQSFGEAEISTYVAALEALAEGVPFVASADVTMTINDNGRVSISCVLTFEDGTSYTFEIDTTSAITVNFEAA